MKRDRRIWLGLAMLLLLISGVLLVPSVRWPIYGWLRSEAFYQGMPTSWWGKEIEESYYLYVMPGGAEIWYGTPREPLWDQLQRWLNLSTTPATVTADVPLLNGDPEALPVLLALVRAQDAKVRRVAIGGLMGQWDQRAEVIRALLEAVEDPDDEVRQKAIAVLQHMDPEAAAKAGVK
jgi:hypothetical protein